MKPSQYTMTCMGEIAHLSYKGIMCPVKLDFSSGRRTGKSFNGHQYPSPMVRSDRYVYALPAGGEVLGGFDD
jgi:hypothetical protein